MSESFWKKEISFKRKPKATVQEAEPQVVERTESEPFWKKEISFKRKPKATVQEAEPQVVERTVEAVTAPPPPRGDYGWLTSDFDPEAIPDAMPAIAAPPVDAPPVEAPPVEAAPVEAPPVEVPAVEVPVAEPERPAAEIAEPKQPKQQKQKKQKEPKKPKEPKAKKEKKEKKESALRREVKLPKLELRRRPKQVSDSELIRAAAAKRTVRRSSPGRGPRSRRKARRAARSSG